jgi:hypothetical protein
MVRITGPLFSEKASGKFGKNIVFRCGKFVVKRPDMKEKEGSEGQNFQREKFKDAAEVWKTILTPEQKTNWGNFAKSIRNEWGYFTIPTPLGPIYVRPGFKIEWLECIKTAGYNGYQYFICCYLRFGTEGWTEYPNPPPFS